MYTGSLNILQETTMNLSLTAFLRTSEVLITHTNIIPTLLGSSGWGKTTATVKYYESKGYKVIRLVAGDIPDSISIMPSIATGAIEVWLLNILREAFTSNEPVLIILDELQTLDRATDQAIVVLRQMMLDRNISGTNIPDNVKFVILGNNPEDTKSNRSYEQYLPNMFTNNLAVFTLEISDMQRWKESLPKDWEYHSKEFLECMTVELYTQTNPRFTSQVSNLLAHDLSVAKTLVASKIGSSYAFAFMAQVAAYRARKPKVLNTAIDVFNQAITDGSITNIAPESLALLSANDITNLRTLGIEV